MAAQPEKQTQNPATNTYDGLPQHQSQNHRFGKYQPRSILYGRNKIHHRKPDQQNARTHAANLPLQPLRGQDLPRNRRNYRNQCAQRHSQYPTGFGHHANRTERLSHHFNYRPVFQRYTIIKKLPFFKKIYLTKNALFRCKCRAPTHHIVVNRQSIISLSGKITKGKIMDSLRAAQIHNALATLCKKWTKNYYIST